MVNHLRFDQHCIFGERFHPLFRRMVLIAVSRWLRGRVSAGLNVALLDFKHTQLLLLSGLINLLRDRTRLQNRDRSFGAHRGVMLCKLLSQLLIVDRPSRRANLELLGGVFLRLNDDPLCLFVLFLDCLANALKSLGLLVVIVAIFFFELVLIRVTLFLVCLVFHNLNFPCLL